MIQFTYKEAAKQYYMEPAGENAVGFICEFFSNLDPRPAKEQIAENYAHGGGWTPMDNLTATEDFSLKYPGDPAMPVLAEARVNSEMVRVYPYGIVAIFQDDGSFEATRCS